MFLCHFIRVLNISELAMNPFKDEFFNWLMPLVASKWGVVVVASPLPVKGVGNTNLLWWGTWRRPCLHLHPWWRGPGIPSHQCCPSGWLCCQDPRLLPPSSSGSISLYFCSPLFSFIASFHDLLSTLPCLLCS